MQLLSALLPLALLGAAGCQGERAGAEERSPDNTALEKPAEPTVQQPSERREAPRAGEQPAAAGEPQKTSAGAMASAVDDIVKARCEREERCDNVGSGKKFTSRSACETEVRAEWRADLNAYECPQGIDQDDLEECMAEIRNEKCDSVMDKLGRITACRSSDICKD